MIWCEDFINARKASSYTRVIDWILKVARCHFSYNPLEYKIYGWKTPRHLRDYQYLQLLTFIVVVELMILYDFQRRRLLG